LDGEDVWMDAEDVVGIGENVGEIGDMGLEVYD
jgi:hypothetical protein